MRRKPLLLPVLLVTAARRLDSGRMAPARNRIEPGTASLTR